MRNKSPERRTLKGRKTAVPVWAAGVFGALCFLSLWHLTDVRAGAVQTGHSWLYVNYGLLTAGGLAVLALLAWGSWGAEACGKKSRPWPLEGRYVLLGLGLGLMFMTVLAPLSAPDEISHYISAYELSSRLLGRESRAEDGRVYIRTEDAFIEDLEDVMKEDGTGWREEAGEAAGMQTASGAQDTADSPPDAIVFGQELTEDVYRQIRERGLGSSGEEGISVSYQPPVNTTPLAYVPQALGLALGRLLGLGGLGLLYLGRLFNLVFFVTAGWFTIRRMPFGKEVVMGVFLLPMTLHLSASFSYDVMILALSSLFGAVCLDLAFRAERVRWKDVVLLAFLLGVMGPCKMVYGVIAGWCLLIPVKKFGKTWKWLLSAAMVLGAFLGAMVLVNSRTVAMYTEASESYVPWAGEAGYTFGQLVHSPMLVLKMCYNTLMWKGEMLYSGLIGGALGQMDAVLNTPYIVVLALTAILVVLALKKPGEAQELKMGHRVWIWFLALLCLGALMFSMLLAWTPVSSNVIQGVQGRYLLPMLPMVLLTLKNDRVVRTSWDDRGVFFVMAGLDVYVIVRIFATVCLRV